MTDPVDLFLSLVQRPPAFVLSDGKGPYFYFQEGVTVVLLDGIFRVGEEALRLESPHAAAKWVNRHWDDGDEY